VINWIKPVQPDDGLGAIKPRYGAAAATTELVYDGVCVPRLHLSNTAQIQPWNAVLGPHLPGPKELRSINASTSFDIASSMFFSVPVQSLCVYQSTQNATAPNFASMGFLRHLISYWHRQMSKAETNFSALTNEVEVDDEEAESLRSSLADYLHRYSDIGMHVIINRLLRDGISPEIRHMFFVEIAKIDDEHTFLDRRNLLKEALRSTDTSVRYSAAVALGLMREDSLAKAALVDQGKREKNRAVRRMIDAQLD
jgi:hypothetical protein